MPRWVDAREEEGDVDEEESSSEEDEEQQQIDPDDEVLEQAAEDGEQDPGQDNDERAQTGAAAGPSGQKQKITIPLGNRKLVCHVRSSLIADMMATLSGERCRAEHGHAASRS